MKAFCIGCQKEHEGFNWKFKDYVDEKGKRESGWFCRRYFKPTEYEWVPERIKEERKEYFNSIVQPYRHGELSREYIEANGTRGIKATPEEVRKSRYVWKDLPNWRNRQKSK